jgi:hypothetical protein
MIEKLPVKPRRQGMFCALDAARRNSGKLQTQELCSAYFGEPALDFVFS